MAKLRLEVESFTPNTVRNFLAYLRATDGRPRWGAAAHCRASRKMSAGVVATLGDNHPAFQVQIQDKVGNPIGFSSWDAELLLRNTQTGQT